MARACTICTHAEREAIDEAIVGGVSYRNVAKRFEGVSLAGVQRHAARHLSTTLQAVHARRVAEDEASAATALDRFEELYGRASALLEAAEREGQGRMALDAIRELRGLLERIARITGELDDRPQVVNVLVSPEWQQVRAAIVQALMDFPEARQAVASRLLALEAGEAGGPSSAVASTHQLPRPAGELTP